MKVGPRCGTIIFLFLLGLVAMGVALWSKVYLSDRDLLRHCMNINKGELLPYPNGCAKPLSIEGDSFIFINTEGKQEIYIVVSKRDGEYFYYEITRH